MNKKLYIILVILLVAIIGFLLYNNKATAPEADYTLDGSEITM